MAEGRGERTIGSGHLVALFLGIVVLCCVFFILGYEMGRAQFEKGGSTAVAAKPAATPPLAAKEEPASPGWPSGAAGGASAPAKTAPPAASAQPAKSTAPAKPPAASSPAGGAASNGLKAPDIPRGSFIVQVAANRVQSDALNLAKLLQGKGFPAFVLTPSTPDDWYRVQVGPYADAKSADQAKAALSRQGFNNAIVKH
jgi:cell division septation protein DedD